MTVGDDCFPLSFSVVSIERVISVNWELSLCPWIGRTSEAESSADVMDFLQRDGAPVMGLSKDN